MLEVLAVARRQGFTRESCCEEGEAVVERLCRGSGEEALDVEGLERRRFDRGEVGQNGGEIWSVSELEGLVDMGMGVLVWFEVEEESWSEGPGSRWVASWFW
jgi:hypothetical protein